jgi:tetratricopeptide (TPR) repeat protein
MNLDNPIIKLCIAGTQAEFDGNMEAACQLYWQAWKAARDDYEACIAAHYVARCQESPTESLHWNQVALEKANVVNDDSVRDFYPSLYLNIGRSYELLGDQNKAEKYYSQAADLGVAHQLDKE